VSGSGISWAICKSAPRSRHITMPTPTTQFFAGWMPFLPPNQECQSTEGIICSTPILLFAYFINTVISYCLAFCLFSSNILNQNFNLAFLLFIGLFLILNVHLKCIDTVGSVSGRASNCGLPTFSYTHNCFTALCTRW